MNDTATDSSGQVTAGFYVVAREPGAENPSLPTWGNESLNPLALDNNYQGDVIRKDLAAVPGGFQLLNVFSAEECQRFIELTEQLEYLPDAPVSLPRRVRHNDNVTWVVDTATEELIWQRVKSLFPPEAIYDDREALGLNARFRFYRYQQDDFFRPHIDGDWPGSRIVDRELITNAYPDRWSRMTFLILLSDDFLGGSTQFWVDKNNPRLPATNASDAHLVDVRTPRGGVLCFPHGTHPLHCLHSSEPILKGVKYIIRTDVLFSL
ncbi:prolyl hydroxylase family protein [Aliamphritea hakodatensis]|uniref:prolyl hydroxylase family protein n=1 Tax=Aliamphritea hakodatensis TaxID=2895352 RepID=UPI0022FD447E|nr:2OG-Fe(II) oxygenase [Aliamphritea hakodatensis]